MKSDSSRARFTRKKKLQIKTYVRTFLILNKGPLY